MGQDRWDGETADDDLAAFEAQFDRQEIREFRTDNALPPTVPEVRSRRHVDLGVGGSLLEEADRIDAARTRPDLLRDPVLYACSLVALTTAVAITLVLVQPWHLVLRLVVALIVAVVGALAFLMILGRRGPRPEAEVLRKEARLEQRTADQLTMPPRWRLLHDRVLPGTEHRVPFVLVGPAGVLIATIMPAGPYGLIDGGGVTAGDGDLNVWVTTRRWEVTTLADHLVNHRDGAWQFGGPVYSLVLQARPPAAAADGLMSEPPRLIEGLSAIRKPTACRDFLGSLPAVLPQHVVDDLEQQVDRLCPLAPSGT